MKRLSLLMIVAVMFMAVSCSKDERIEKNLYKKGGDWKITTYLLQTGSLNPSVNDYQSISMTDCGKFHFSEDGTGVATFNINGGTQSASFKYSNNDKELTVIYENGTSQTYNLDWSKNKMTIDYNDSTTDSDGYTNWDTETVVLTKI